MLAKFFIRIREFLLNLAIDKTKKDVLLKRLNQEIMRDNLFHTDLTLQLNLFLIFWE